MERFLIFVVVLIFTALVPLKAHSLAKVGVASPEFSLKDQTGKTHSLSQYKGRYVVLEWFNPECPFVKKYYSGGNMQALQDKFTKEGVIWLSISSSAEGKQGYMTGSVAQETLAKLGSKSTALLLDSSGTVGKEYIARTTPHVFLVSPEGVLLYEGAIDDTPSTDPADIPNSKNLLEAAYSEAKSGKAVTLASTEPYGCSVKYAS